MPANIDYDRGVVKRIHPSGAEVYMYRDEPGVYRNAFGSEISDKMATECGMNVEKYAKARRKKEMLDKAYEAIELELADDSDVQRTVVQERGGFNLIALGLGRHILEDPDGNNLTPGKHLTLEEGKILFSKMAPVPEGVKKIPPKVNRKAMTDEEVIAEANKS